jgi:hypothetical protein
VPLFQRNEANGQAGLDEQPEPASAEAPSEIAPEGGEGDVAS